MRRRTFLTTFTSGVCLALILCGALALMYRPSATSQLPSPAPAVTQDEVGAPVTEAVVLPGESLSSSRQEVLEGLAARDAPAAEKGSSYHHQERVNGSLIVFVRSAADGAAIPEAFVGVNASALAKQPSSSRGATKDSEIIVTIDLDDSGRAEFEVVPGNDVELTVVPPSSWIPPASSMEILSLNRNEVREVVVHLDRREATTLGGQVLRQSDGSPLPGAEVSLHERRLMRIKDELRDKSIVVARSLTDKDGRFALSASINSIMYGAIRCKGYELVLFDGSQLTRDDSTFRLEESAALVIRLWGIPGVASDGLLIEAELPSEALAPYGAGQIVRGRPPQHWNAVNDDHDGGLWRMEDLPPNKPLTLIVRNGTGVIYRSAEPVYCAPGSRGQVEIHVGLPGLIEGLVLDSSQNAVSQAEVWLCEAKDDPPVGTRKRLSVREPPDQKSVTDESGRFSFTATHGSSYWIGAKVPQITEGEWRGWADLLTLEDPVTSVVLTLAEPCVTSGIVRDQSGRAVGGVTVIASCQDGVYDFVTTDRKGRFYLPWIGLGHEFQLQARIPERIASRLVTAFGGDQDIELPLLSPGSLVLVPQGAVGGVSFNATLVLSGPSPVGRGSSAGSRDGIIRFDRVEPGQYVVLVISDDGMTGSCEVVLIEEAEYKEVAVLVGPLAALAMQNDCDAKMSVWIKYNGCVMTQMAVEPRSHQVWKGPPGEVEIILSCCAQHGPQKHSKILDAGAAVRVP